MGWYQEHCAVELAKLATPNVGVVTPSDVLAYRKIWDSYVLGIVKASLDCSKVAGIDPTLASTHSGASDTILTLWNQDAGLTDAEILLQAKSILAHEQDTVLQAGKLVPGIKRDCPKVPIPPIPTLALQQAAIGAIQGQGILASGILQLIGLGADGAAQTIGAFIPGSGVNPTGPLGDFVTQLKWIVGGVAVVAVLVMVAPALTPLVGAALANRGHK